MRIHDQNPAPLNPAGTGASRGPGQSQAPQGAAPGQGTSAPDALRSSHSGPDRVSLSNLAANLQPPPPDREAELEQLSALFDRGLYQPDPGAVAEGLINEGLLPPDDPKTDPGNSG